jgi:hypothetical protein
MAKKITLQIPEPCHEDWNQMTPQGLGRHCESCAKTVVDFTAKSDKFIASYFKKHDNICGRFRSDQLNRPIDLSVRRNAILPPLAASFILPLAMLAASSAYGQESPKQFSRDASYVSLHIGSQKQQAYKDIKGVVTDTAGNPLPGVRISILETNDQIQTDNKGTYRLKAQVGHTLRFSSYLYLTEEIQVHEHQDIYSFALQYSPEHLPEVVVVAQAIKRVSVTLGGVLQLEEPMEKQVDNDTVKTVRGNIIDDTDLPLPGVAVVIRGTTHSTMSDFDGNFEIEVKPGQELQFSYVGFETVELPIARSTDTLNVKMVPGTEFENMLVVGQLVVKQGGISVTEVYPEDFRSSYNPSTNFNGNPQLQEDRARYANTIEFQRLEREKKKAARRARKKRK